MALYSVKTDTKQQFNISKMLILKFFTLIFSPENLKNFQKKTFFTTLVLQQIKDKNMILKDLIKGKLVKRYKRFFMDVELENGEIITAHCTNTGSMKSLLDNSPYVYVTHVDDPKRKLKYTAQILELSDGTFVVCNTMLPNKIVYEAVEQKLIPELADYDLLKSEVKYGDENSRIDIYLEKGDLKTFVEIKNTTLKEDDTPDCAQFPDSPTERGQKHLRELAKEAEKGNRAVMLYHVSRTDSTAFKIAEHIDPKYKELCTAGQKVGLEVLPYQVTVKFEGNDAHITLEKKLPFKD